jgi:hypothetical protein
MHTTILSNTLQTLAAILPCYGPNGDSATILTATGTFTNSPIGIRAALHRLARERAIDLAALKRQTEQATGQRILHILPLADDLVLVPVKIRTPQVNRDNCTGYVNACCVATVRGTSAHPYKSLIVLKSGTEIPTLWTPATIEKYLRAARLLAGKQAYTGPTNVQPEIVAISRKLVEVFQDILALRTKTM